MFAFPYLPHRFLWTPDEFIAAQPQAQRPPSASAVRARGAAQADHTQPDREPARSGSGASRTP